MIQSENRSISKGYIRPASVTYPNAITGTEDLVETHRLPLRPIHATHLHPSPHGYGGGHNGIATYSRCDR
ncbi:MAG: hypothetical protein NPIRA06_30250 [Nitrospirales bacterium]|nr:MAG: hypothetical protein NPIRA06_30250 [Nitrospirales bacterium]